MDIQSKREEIQALIDNIKEHSDRLKRSKSLPLLELSVILSKITKLHEKTLILKYLAAVDQNHEEEEFGSRPIGTKKYDDTDEEEIEIKVEEKIVEELVPEFKKPSEEEKEVVVPEVENREEEPQEVDLSIEEIESQQELDSKPDLNEAFTEEEDPSLSGQLKKQPIQDLLTAIGLNERYLYANELFDGDIDEFKEVVRHLNEFENGIEAKNYFENELQNNYAWEKDNPMVKALFLLVERRFN